jgi:cellulose synthase/poly-beta-1,6-N-acetylglucosamine synthase-like glycosyltransferase
MWEWTAALLFFVPAMVIAALYGAFTALGLLPSRKAEPPGRFPVHSFAILVPAHDEETHLPRCLRSIPGHPGLRTIVVADNCSDGTAAVAERHGAECLVRNNPDLIGKGYALAFGMPAAMAHRPDAVLILDADCELAPGTLEAFDAALAAGAAAVQAPLVVRHSRHHPGEYVAAVGAEVDAALHRGLSRCGGSVPLRGTGMLFRRDVLEAHPWSMHGLAEDAEFSVVLRRAGLRIHLLHRGAIRTEAPFGSKALLQQRRRWRAALTVNGLGAVERMLASKPLILVHLLISLAMSFAAPVSAFWTWGMLAASAFTLLVYLRAMAAAGFRWPGLGAAVMVARLAAVTLAGFWNRESSWQRTARR